MIVLLIEFDSFVKEPQKIEDVDVEDGIKSLLKSYMRPLIVILICISSLILVALFLSSNVDGYKEGKKTLPARKYDRYPGQPLW